MRFGERGESGRTRSCPQKLSAFLAFVFRGERTDPCGPAAVAALCFTTPLWTGWGPRLQKVANVSNVEGRNSGEADESGERERGRTDQSWQKAGPHEMRTVHEGTILGSSRTAEV